MKEIWKPVVGFEGFYEVSNMGRIKALERVVENNGGLQRKHEKILCQHYSKYLTVVLCKNAKTYPRTVHRLVAEAFIPNPENKPNVDHIDTDNTNNCVNNLRWVTQKENCMNPITREHNSKSKMGLKKGIKLSEEHRKKISEGIKRHYRNRRENKK